MEPVQTAFNFDGLTFPNPESTLTKIETKCYDLIPIGKEKAVSAEYLAKTLDIDTRTVTANIRRLRLKHCDIGSLRDIGYYRFKDPHEYLEYMAAAEKEQARRYQVLNAMKHTPMAQQVTANLNNLSKERLKNDKISN
ncbi:HTH domain-containing protein [Lactobacillus sp. UMNPBX1]|uniref:HTH domain-containing protein n=1 Tax=Lactobacillus TaxID=1578 RepID=UPI000B5DB2C9|nr:MULTISPECIES: HTH domain-containing protein [Lactobacillus]OXC14685.1 hypothetical protein AYP77_07560 [Lactobacillus crispatus]PEH12975.1 HTH domain-containing protein [Lactobacillus sp. UMNPBX1]